MFKIYQRIISFFQRPKPKDFGNFIEAHKEAEVKEIFAYNIPIEKSVEYSIGFLKNKNTELINTVKNTDYERNMFLYEIGFVKLKRVRDFMSTMNIVGNIETFQKVEEKYSKYNLEILNVEMLEIIKREFDFKQETHDKFDSFIADSAIDKLKENYLNLEKDGLIFDLYKAYYTSDPFKIVTSENANDFIKNHLKDLKSSLTDKNQPYLTGSYYYMIKKKVFYVCYNEYNKGMVLVEIEPNHYIILTEWSDADGNKLNKLNFKEFIKSEI